MNQDDQNIIGTMIKSSASEVKKTLRQEIEDSAESVKKTLREEIKKSVQTSGNALKKEIIRSENDLKAMIRGSEATLKQKTKTLEEKIDTLEEKVEKMDCDVRYNGVLMERLQDSMQLILEGHATTHDRLDRVEEDLDVNQVGRVPILWETTKKHSRRIRKLERTTS